MLGAECTGKSTLALALQSALSAKGYRTTRVDEFLRTWCQQHQRTPRAEEQAAIACAQTDAIQATATGGCDMVIGDTTALTTAVYSELLFGDTRLYPRALQHQRRYALTLLAGTDLPWERDGIQRDGAAAQLRFDTRLREVLVQHGIAFCTVLGQGPVRVQNALRTIDTHLLHQPARDMGAQPAWKWMCERCSDAACEHRLFQGLLQQR